MHFCCRAPYVARGLKLYRVLCLRHPEQSRAPYGARGLKFLWLLSQFFGLLSRPVWGAWIEIRGLVLDTIRQRGRAPYGARGLKLLFRMMFHLLKRRAPYGARGLKFLANF